MGSTSENLMKFQELDVADLREVFNAITQKILGFKNREAVFCSLVKLLLIRGGDYSNEKVNSVLLIISII